MIVKIFRINFLDKNTQQHLFVSFSLASKKFNLILCGSKLFTWMEKMKKKFLLPAILLLNTIATENNFIEKRLKDMWRDEKMPNFEIMKKEYEEYKKIIVEKRDAENLQNALMKIYTRYSGECSENITAISHDRKTIEVEKFIANIQQEHFIENHFNNPLFIKKYLSVLRAACKKNYPLFIEELEKLHDQNPLKNDLKQGWIKSLSHLLQKINLF